MVGGSFGAAGLPRRSRGAAIQRAMTGAIGDALAADTIAGCRTRRPAAP
ncbi:MAG: hypothetical protein R3B82_03750 [Sandaracinaceae bacterium]